LQLLNEYFAADLNPGWLLSVPSLGVCMFEVFIGDDVVRRCYLRRHVAIIGLHNVFGLDFGTGIGPSLLLPRRGAVPTGMGRPRFSKLRATPASFIVYIWRQRSVSPPPLVHVKPFDEARSKGLRFIFGAATGAAIMLY
jgi:hypothetical protein